MILKATKIGNCNEMVSGEQGLAVAVAVARE